MGTNVGSIEIDLTLRTDQFDAGLASAEREMRGLKSNLGKIDPGLGDAGKKARSWSDGLKSANQQLAYLGQNLMQAKQIIGGVFGEAQEWADLGLQAQKNEYALDQMAGSAQEAQRWIDALQGALNNTVTDGEAAAQAYQLMRFGLADSAEAAGDFARDIAIVAQANPQLGGTSEAINQIQLTLANMSFMRLDQLGLSAAAVKNRMKELQSETDGLSKEQAFQQAVMEGLGEQAAILGDEFLEIGSAQAELRARIRGFKEDVGQEISEGFEGASRAALGFLDVMDEIGTQAAIGVGLKGTGDILEYVQDQAGAVGDVMKGTPIGFSILYSQKALQWAGDQLISDAQDNMTTPATPAGPGPMMMMAARHTAQSRNQSLIPGIYGRQGDPLSRERWDKFYSAFDTGGGSFFDSFSPSARLTAAQRDVRAEQTNQARYQRRLRSGRRQDIAAGGAQNIGAILSGAAGAIDTIQAGQQFTAAFEAVAGAASSATTAMFGFVGSGDQVIQQWDSLSDKFGLGAENIDVEIYDEMTAKLDELGVETEAAAAAMDLYQHSVGMASASQEAFDAILGNITESFAAGEISAAEYVQQIEALKNTDLSGLDAMLAPLLATNPDAYMQVVGNMQGVSTETLGAYANPVETAGAVFGAVRGALGIGGEGETEESPISTMDAEIAGLSETGDNSANSIAASFSTMKDSALGDIALIDQALQSLSSTPITIGVNWGGPTAPMSSANQTVIEIDGQAVATATSEANRRNNQQGPGF